MLAGLADELCGHGAGEGGPQLAGDTVPGGSVIAPHTVDNALPPLSAYDAAPRAAESGQPKMACERSAVKFLL